MSLLWNDFTDGTHISLTVGPAVGSIRELFTKVKSINSKHGQFELVLCVGDFFGPSGTRGQESPDISSLLNGEINGLDHLRDVCLSANSIYHSAIAVLCYARRTSDTREGYREICQHGK